MPRGPKINFVNQLTPSAVVKLSAFAKEYGDHEGVVLSRLVEWLAKQEEEVRREAISAPIRVYHKHPADPGKTPDQLAN